MTREEPEGEPLEEAALSTCPYCGEEVEVAVEPVGASHEQYVEDCPVCCRPWNVLVARTEEGLDVQLTRDDD